MKSSAVICSRNDNYGGNLIYRSMICLNSMVETFDEVWYIDWNSPTRSLIEEIRQDLSITGKLRHIVIDEDTANLLVRYDPDAQKCCEALARNLGIRRATGDWIISTNIDILAPEKLEFDLLLSQLDEKTFYTLSRRGINPPEIELYPNSKDWKLMREYCRKTLPPRDHKEKTVQGDDYSIINCCGDFQLAHKNIWNNVRGFEEGMIYSLYTDTNIQKKAAMHGFGLKAIFEPPMFHIWHGKGGGGFLDGINKKGNDPMKYITTFTKTENPENWGLSDTEIEYEII